jgi:hypothetical protein
VNVRLPRCTFSIYCTLLGAPQQNGSLLPKEVLRRYLVPGYQYCTSCIPVPVNGYGTSYRYSVRYKFIHSTVPGTRLPGIVQYQVQYLVQYCTCTGMSAVHSRAHCIQYVYKSTYQVLVFFCLRSLQRTLHTVFVFVLFCLQFTPTHIAYSMYTVRTRILLSAVHSSHAPRTLHRKGK